MFLVIEEVIILNRVAIKRLNKYSRLQKEIKAADLKRLIAKNPVKLLPIENQLERSDFEWLHM
jgi:NADH/NAD ratio-sensing transcriptional regulator Rex